VTAVTACRAGAGGNRRALLEDPRALERDLAEPIHLENDLLHPRAVSLEAER